MINLKKIKLLIILIAANCFAISVVANELTPLQKGVMQQCDAYLNQSGTQPLSDYMSNMTPKNAAQVQANLTYCDQNSFCQYSTNENCAGKMLAWKFIQKPSSASASDTQNTLTPTRNPALRSTQIKAVTENSTPAPASASAAAYKVPPAGLPAAAPAPTLTTPEPAQSTPAPVAAPAPEAASAPTQQQQQSINWF